MAQTAGGISVAAAASTVTFQTGGRQKPAVSVSVKPIDDNYYNKKNPITAIAGGDGIRVVQLHEYKEAAACLADAFALDDVVWYLIDTPDNARLSKEEKWDLHVKILEYITCAHIMKGLVLAAGPNYDAVALWMPPGTDIDDYMTTFRSGLWRLNYQLSAEGKTRFFTEFLPLLHETKHQVMGARDDDSWYLVYLGTKSTSRGKGYAKKLVNHVTAMADAEGQACYLESSNPVNLPIYEKMGFAVAKKIYLQRAKEHVAMDIMVREPEMVEKVE